MKLSIDQLILEEKKLHRKGSSVSLSTSFLQVGSLPKKMHFKEKSLMQFF